MNFVLDASAAAGWFLPDERTDYTESIFEAVSGPDEAFIPTLWAYEIRNIVLKGIRRGRVTPTVARPLLSALSQLRLRPMETRFDSTLDTAMKFSLSFYDAAYLDLAIQESLPLATLDKGLREAARLAGVPLYGEVE